MQGHRLAVYERWEDIAGVKSTIEELTSRLSTFRRDSVLWVCSFLTVSLRLFEPNSPERTSYFMMIDHFFAPRLANRLKLGFWNADPQRILVHRTQLLLIAKLAFEHCAESGLNAGVSKHGFGFALLMANDHLGYGLINREFVANGDRHVCATLMAELLTMQEFSGHIRVGPIVRAYLMLEDIPRQLFAHPDYVDVERSLEASFGLTFREFFAMTIAAISRYITLKSSDLDGSGRPLVSHPVQFASLQVSREKVLRYYDILSRGAQSLENELRRLPGDRGDNTIFRKFPVVACWFDVGTIDMSLGYLPLDVELWMEKAYNAPFWFLFGKHRARFSRFWGAVFEKYITSLFENRDLPLGTLFIPNPSSPDSPNEELCDGVLVCDDTIVIFEYKSVLIRADIKYGGGVEKLTKHLEDKFVCDSITKQPKAVKQLASTAACLFQEKRPDVPWTDLRAIKKCFLVCVTLDTIGAAMGMSTFLESYLKENLNRASLPGVEIRPLACIDVDTLERVLLALGNTPFSTVLERWYQVNPPMSMPLSSISMPDLISPPSEENHGEWTRVMEMAMTELFDEETIRAGAKLWSSDSAASQLGWFGANGSLRLWTGRV